ncbi:MAG: RidA family protein [Hyphomicrobiaceae bacterium]
MGKGVTYLNPKSAPPPGMYSHVAIAEPGRIAYIAGQTSVDMNGKPVGAGDMAAQIKTVFGNMERILKELGCDFSDVLQYTTYIVGGERREAWQKSRKDLFQTLYPGGPGTYPPNTLLVIDGLANPDYVLEISAIVRLRD